jgi:predicted nucleic acid-binding protein
MKSYVLDTSAILALREDEPGAQLVSNLLHKSKSKQDTLFVSFISVIEVFYCTWQKEGKGSAYKTYLELKMLPIRQIESAPSLLLLAGELKANYKLSLGDCWIAATAIEKTATLVHKDPEFEQLADIVSLKALPYKQG